VTGDVVVDSRWGARVDRDLLLLLPDVLIEDFDPEAAAQALWPMADALWQSSGWNGSPNFDANGAWSAPPS
jgi:hypothetical protein